MLFDNLRYCNNLSSKMKHLQCNHMSFLNEEHSHDVFFIVRKSHFSFSQDWNTSMEE
jgi:hypothetical protein